MLGYTHRIHGASTTCKEMFGNYRVTGTRRIVPKVFYTTLQVQLQAPIKCEKVDPFIMDLMIKEVQPEETPPGQLTEIIL